MSKSTISQEPTMTAIESASYYATSHTGGVVIDASILVPTVEEARELAAQFPKSIKVRAGRHSRPLNGSYLNGSETVGSLRVHVNLIATGTTGEFNETGARRWKNFKKHADRLGIALEYRTPYSNSLTHDEAAAL